MLSPGDATPTSSRTKHRPWQYDWKRPQVKEVNGLKEGAIDVTAAQASMSEISSLEDSEDLCMLTATLYNHVIVMQVIQPPSSTILKTRELRWPGSLLRDGDRIVSVAFCRRPNSSCSSWSISDADALHVVNKLSLGMFPLDANESYYQDSSGEPEREPEQKQTQDLASDLLLACLTCDFTLHFYKAIDLLSGHVTPPEDEIEAGLANLLLGSGFFLQMQQSLFPLSKPCFTVSLSVPFQKSLSPNQQQKGWQTLPFFSSPQSEGVNIDMWDESLWNATVEPSTSIHRTLKNQVTGVVAVFGYAVIYGKGVRTRRARKQASQPDVMVEGMDVIENRPVPEANAEWRQAGENSREERWESEHDHSCTELSHEGPWWKHFKASDRAHMEEYTETGGFLTFVDLANESEMRTLYLPFPAKSIYPMKWGTMSIVIVLADELYTSEAKAVMIRLDAAMQVHFPCGASPTTRPSMPKEAEQGSTAKKPVCEVKRFHLIPILLPTQDQALPHTGGSKTLAASSYLCSSPSVEMIFFGELNQSEKCALTITLNCLSVFDLVEPDVLASFPNWAQSNNRVTVVRTRQEMGHSVRVPDEVESSVLNLVQSQVFQGCSILQLAKERYFICWDGASKLRGAFISRLSSTNGKDNSGPSCVVLPTKAFNRLDKSELRADLYVQDDDVDNSTRDLNLPFTDMPCPSLIEDNSEKTSDYVSSALDSISSLRYNGTDTPQTTPKVTRTGRLSHIEKSERLVKHCDSWMQLDDSATKKALFETQTPAVVVMHGTATSIFSFRTSFVRNGVATPFSQILSWLAQERDFYTAATIALGLLRDVDSLRDLRRSHGLEESDLEDEGASIDSLLDGIVKLYPEGSLTLKPRSSMITQVADMTVGCLVRGGLMMSTTLESFLRRSPDYNSARAQIMLAAVTTRCLSGDKDIVNISMGSRYTYSEASRPEDLLWGLRSLLIVGDSRDHMAQGIILVNAAMADELRDRQPSNQENTLPSGLSKIMVATIVGSSPEASSLLLSLIDEESRQRYWESLTHDARLQFALIKVGDTFPLLREMEVRSWARCTLAECVCQEPAPSAVSLLETIPTQWLQLFCEGCLSNAGCDYGTILTYGINEKDVLVDDDEGISEYIADIVKTRKALEASHDSNSIDFDLLIPALLILEQREVIWTEESIVATQLVLDAACHHAGRPGRSKFPFDGKTAMKQCVMANNVSAGANLIGGNNGFILQCCNVLIQEASLDMATAEDFLRNDQLSREVLSSRRRNGVKVSDGHRHILCLLSEHVLSVRTYGEFNVTTERRKVDPVFAARCCLRTWFCISFMSKASTAWLVSWLRKMLEMGNQQISPRRLACAAFTRSLMWPAAPGEILANEMEFESVFLVELAQGCHGLIESVPPNIAKQVISQVDAPGNFDVGSFVRDLK